jgi:hypothetical protein
MLESAQVIFRLGDKPLRFRGQLLGESSICDEDDTGLYTRVRLFKTEGGSLIWAWDLSESDEPTEEELERADALVVDASAGPAAEVAQTAWEKRPRGNARLVEASTRAFNIAARHDGAVADALYEDVK